MFSKEQLESEADISRKAWKPLFWIAAALSLLGLPHSQYQDAIKMAVWTVIFVSLIVTYTWPFVVDIVSGSVVTLMVLLHIPLMLWIYPHIPHHGYLVIGLAIVVEYLVCLAPIAWLDLRSERARQGQQ